jgi:hypothetical protein
MTVPPDDVPAIDTVQVQEAADHLAAAATDLHADTSGLDRNVPEVPYDWFDLRVAVVRLDEAREAFDHRLADLLHDQAGRAFAQVFASSQVDGMPVLPLPRAAW